MADETLAFDLLVRDRNASRTLKSVGDAATRTGKDFDSAAGGAGKLAAEIDETTLRLKELGEEFDRTGDRSLLKDIGKERRTLAGLTKLRKEMAELAGETAKVGKVGLSGLTDAVEALPQQLRGGLIVGIGAVAVAAAPMVGAALAGAIGGAVGSGAIAAGIAGAARSPQVQAAWQELADSAESVFADFSAPFVRPTVSAIDELRDALGDISDDLSGIGRDAAGFVEPLARGFAGLVREMMPGLREMIRDARPIFDMLEDELPDVGNALESFFESIGDGSEGGAEALRDLLEITEKVIVATGEALEFAGKHWDDFKQGMIDTLGPLGDLLALLVDIASEDDSIIGRQGASMAKGGARALKDVAEAADDVAFSVKGMSDAFSDWLGLTLNAEELADRFKLSLLELDDAVEKNGNGLDDSTEGGLKNQQEIRDRIELLDRIRRSQIETAGGTEEAVKRANAAYDAEIKKLIEVGVKAGLSRAELENLAGPYAINIYMTGLERIRQQLQALSAAASVVPGLGGAAIGFHLAQGIIGGALAQAKGGIVAAAQGMITSSPTVLFGERQTGQEAFIPKQGISRQRGMALASQAAAWHGASVVPNERMGGGGGGPVTLDFSGLRGGDELLAQWLHRNLSAGRIQLKVSGSRVVVG